MDELVKLVAQRVGLPEAQAKGAVETVIGYLKQHLPAPIAAQLETALGSEATMKQAEQLLDQGLDTLGALFGKK